MTKTSLNNIFEKGTLLKVWFSENPHIDGINYSETSANDWYYAKIIKSYENDFVIKYFCDNKVEIVKYSDNWPKWRFEKISRVRFNVRGYGPLNRKHTLYITKENKTNDVTKFLSNYYKKRRKKNVKIFNKFRGKKSIGVNDLLIKYLSPNSNNQFYFTFC